MKAITREIQDRMSPSEALKRLAEGNRRFTQQSPAEVDPMARISETSTGQFPFATILGCIDSRVPAEIVFDQYIGDVFNVRVAGNVVNEDILGSLEFACKEAGSKLILVMGHTDCAAVTAACKMVELGKLTPLLSKIMPAVASFKGASLQVDRVAEEHVRLSMERIRKESPILAGMEKNGQILIRGAMYDVSSGQVNFLD
jgi:carbonic anhydrase